MGAGAVAAAIAARRSARAHRTRCDAVRARNFWRRCALVRARPGLGLRGAIAWNAGRARSRSVGGSLGYRTSTIVPLLEAVLGTGRVAGAFVRRHAGDSLADRAVDRSTEYR